MRATFCKVALLALLAVSAHAATPKAIDIRSAEAAAATPPTWNIATHLTALDVAGMGNGADSPNIYITIDQPVGGCTSGIGYMYYSPPGFNGDVSRQNMHAKAMLSTLQLAFAMGNTVVVVGYTGNGGYCQVVDVVLLNY